MLVLASLSATAEEPADFESEPVLDAATLVRPSLLSGPGFSVEPRVEVRGYMGNFTITTSIGRLGADSVEVLAERIAEIPALEVRMAIRMPQAMAR